MRAFRALGSTASRRSLFLAPKMSDDSDDNADKVPATKVPRKRPAPRKVAKPKAAAEAATEAPAAAVVESKPEPVAEVRPARPMVVRDARRAESRESESRDSEPRESESRDSGPEPIPFFVENSNSEPPGNSKKRRRRKKKHGQSQGQQPHAVAPAPDYYPPQGSEPVASAPAPSPAPVMHAAPRPKLDSDEVSKKAWKIFLSEVGEEGLALIDDHDAREISRRCFRLAEIFLEEASRRNR